MRAHADSFFGQIDGEVAKEADAVREYARNLGDVDNAWILSPYDTWVQNPNYDGPPQPHPEAYEDEDEDPSPSPF